MADALPAPEPLPDDATLARRLEATWRPPRGLIGWLSAADHKSIGRRFMLTGFAFFLLGGLLAVLMRAQLALPENNLLGPDAYNQVFSMHGTTMMFLFAVPIMEAVALYIIPLMLGAREIAFPRLAAFAYWIYLFGGVMIWIAFLMNVGPDVGWFGYAPLSGPEYSPGKRVDFWAQMITFTEISALVVAVQMIVTVLKYRAPGMTLARLPLFIWSMLATDFMILLAMPAVMLASTFLILDRLVGTHFFNPAEGGDAVLWQHLFWFFGHPEVYIIFLPATGMVSAMLPTFCRRPMFAQNAVVLSIIGTAILGFGVWVHHMFAIALPQMGEAFFTAASMLIAIPTILQVFCWIATIWLGRPAFATPFLYVLGFLFTLVLGGLTGIMVASVPFDLQVHDTYFLIAHFHYVLVGGSVLPLIGAFYYWFPKVTGRLISERLGKASFWLTFIGVNVTFFPMHILGMNGMVRRIYTYAGDTGWGPLNALIGLGGVILFFGILTTLVAAVRALRTGARAGDNPWGAGTLEWATSSPPPAYNFLHVPVVRASSDPLWDENEIRPAAAGLAFDEREVLVTTVLDAEPDHRMKLPTPSIWPLLTALATTLLLIGTIFTPWAVVWGTPPVVAAMIGWFWPRKASTEARA